MLRKKSFLFFILALIGSFGLLLTLLKGKPMQLINVKTGFVVVEYKGENTIFHDRFLEESMKKQGIVIPPALRKEFSGKSIVRLGDKDFQKAFKEIYFPLSFNSQTYQWRDRSSEDHSL